mgnify:CR=1 FL=1|jgi:hypothetical protein
MKHLTLRSYCLTQTTIMAITDKMWDGINRVIKMDAKIEILSSVVKISKLKK